MNQNPLIKALKIIQKICESHYMDCNECPLGDGRNQCRIFEKQPWEWDLKSKQKVSNHE